MTIFALRRTLRRTALLQRRHMRIHARDKLDSIAEQITISRTLVSWPKRWRKLAARTVRLCWRSRIHPFFQIRTLKLLCCCYHGSTCKSALLLKACPREMRRSMVLTSTQLSFPNTKSLNKKADYPYLMNLPENYWTERELAIKGEQRFLRELGLKWHNFLLGFSRIFTLEEIAAAAEKARIHEASTPAEVAKLVQGKMFYDAPGNLFYHGFTLDKVVGEKSGKAGYVLVGRG